MILESVIEQVIEQQAERIRSYKGSYKRTPFKEKQYISSHAFIISGVRQCGKSTYMMQLMSKNTKKSVFYLNFETPLLYGFSMNDFSRLDKIIRSKKAGMLFFDEIQIVDGWEIFIREKLDEGYKVFITGSNASLLSQELGTKLTGRHISRELFPFSYTEYLGFHKDKPSEISLVSYMDTGGFPEYNKINYKELLSTLFDDIIVRDIVARYSVKDIKGLQRLAVFLFSNIGNRITASKLKQPLSVKATSTIMTWFSYLEMAYLVFFVPRFSHSSKARLINPRKVYCIDIAMADMVTATTTKDAGRKLENIVFLHLRQHYKELFYFDENGECDFVAIKNGAAEILVQVCYKLNPDNIDREVKGLIKAMNFFNKKEATIVTFSQSDHITEGEMEINVVPAYKYLLAEE